MCYITMRHCFCRFVCPKCQNCTNIFSSNGGVELAKRAGVPHLGTLPIDPRLNVLVGTTRSVLTELPDSNTAKIFKSIIEQITNTNSIHISKD